MAKLMEHDGRAKHRDKWKQPSGKDVNHDLSKTSLRGDGWRVKQRAWILVQLGCGTRILRVIHGMGTRVTFNFQSSGAASDGFARQTLDNRSSRGARGSISIEDGLQIGRRARLMPVHHRFDHPRD
ncbi:MAG: hypothetical protein DMF70_15855, partial [Acidobacteria bacterium]